MPKKHLLLHPDLVAAQQLAYGPNGLACKNVKPETESQEYGACEFELNSHRIKFRVAKITPTKTGQFVTLWKRLGDGPIVPHDRADPVDLFIISVRSGEHFGQFVFPKQVLREQGIVAELGKGGKLGFRVYPPWDKAENAQAKKTQAWQIKYFIEIQPKCDSDRIKLLLSR